MKHIVIDLEMNPISKEFKKQRLGCNREVIEIGAVLLDENYHEISFFKTLVKPQFNSKIEKKYENLTGIKTEMVQEAPFFQEAMNMFLSWCRSISGDIKIYQWSENDFEQIVRETSMKHIDFKDEDKKYIYEWEDFQKEYNEKLGLSRLISLKDAVMYAGVEFVGQPHDALNDARNTASLLEIVRTPDKCKRALEHVIEALNEKPVYSTLGEFMNFGQFVFPA